VRRIREVTQPGPYAETRDALPGEPSPDVSAGSEAERRARLGTWIDQYELVQVLGYGAMGTVYRARHQLIGREYALKLIGGPVASSDVRNRRFLREAQATAQLEHPHVVRLVYSGVTMAGEPYLVMELLEGPSLAAEVAKGPLEPRRAARIVQQLAQGLAAIHARGFVHRDLKPSNVILVPTPRGEVAKILDLGLVGALEPDPSEVRLTQHGHVMGTPLYMAPETFTTQSFRAQADLYSLGVLLHELLSGAPPFNGTMKEVLWHQCFSAPPPLPPALGLDSLALWLMAKEPEQRPANARVVVDDITHRLARGPLREWWDEAPRRLARRGARVPRRVVQGLALGAGLAVAFVVGALAWDRLRAPEVVAESTLGLAPGEGGAPLGVVARAGGASARSLVGARIDDRALEASGAASATAATSRAGAAAPQVPAPAEVARPLAAERATTPPPAGPEARASRPSAPAAVRAASERRRATTREILVTSTPAGARVRSEAGLLGLTPLSVMVASGRATTLTVEADGHAPRRLRLSSRQRTPTVHVRLELAP
jgi:tRNA A-37 threonylcarbamoyl transferase component Bud32